LVLTYRFSDTISRKGHLNLSLTESQLPSPLIDLLLNVHTIDHVSVLSDREKASIEQKKQLQKSHINTMSTVTPSATCSATVIATSSQSRQESCTPLTPSSISAQLLKKRKLPSGIRYASYSTQVISSVFSHMNIIDALEVQKVQN
jgi:hypothetical protein